MIARVLAVTERNFGSALAAAALASDTSIVVEDVSDFDESGQLQIGGDVVAYTSVDADTNTITTAALPDGYAEETFVYLYPLTTNRVAWLGSSDELEDEGMAARVPHALWDRLPLGIRDVDAAEGEAVNAELRGSDLVITDIRSRTPSVDGTFIDPDTLPEVEIDSGSLETDGNPPASSPTPVVSGGVGYLWAKWEPVTNNDFVEYEVHVSIDPDFVPDADTLYTTVSGTTVFIGADDTLLEGGPAYGTGDEIIDGGDSDHTPDETYDAGGA